MAPLFKVPPWKGWNLTLWHLFYLLLELLIERGSRLSFLTTLGYCWEEFSTHTESKRSGMLSRPTVWKRLLRTAPFLLSASPPSTVSTHGDIGPANLTSPAEVELNHLDKLSGNAPPLMCGFWPHLRGGNVASNPDFWTLTKPTLVNLHVIIAVIDFKERGLIPACSALELRRCSIRRPSLKIKMGFYDIFHTAIDILIKALRIPNAFIYSHHLLRTQITT